MEEPKDKAEFQAAMHQYYDLCKDRRRNGAVFLAVCRGKVPSMLHSLYLYFMIIITFIIIINSSSSSGGGGMFLIAFVATFAVSFILRAFKPKHAKNRLFLKV